MLKVHVNLFFISSSVETINKTFPNVVPSNMDMKYEKLCALICRIFKVLYL